MSNTFKMLRPHKCGSAAPVDSMRGLVNAINRECDDLRNAQAHSNLTGLYGIRSSYINDCMLDVRRIQGTRILEVTFRAMDGEEFAKVEVK